MSRAGLSFAPLRKAFTEQEMAADAAYLKRVWTKVMERKSATRPAISCMASWLWPSACCVILADAQLDRIRVDSRLTYEALLEFTAEYIRK